jgi:hypothetical protein
VDWEKNERRKDRSSSFSRWQRFATGVPLRTVADNRSAAARLHAYTPCSAVVCLSEANIFEVLG